MGNRVDPAQTTFNAGELSPMWAARVDMAKYGNGCYKMRNVLPLPQGPARRRSGTIHVAEAKDSNDRGWLLEFIYSEDDSYVLEFGDGYIRFFANGGRVLYGKPGNYNGATAYAVGDMAFDTVSGESFYCIRATTGNAPPNATYWYQLPSNPPIYEIPSPYTLAQLTNTDGTFALDWEQTGDVIFLTHPEHFPKKLTRFSGTRWTCVDASITNGPFVTQNPDEARTVYASAETGSITLTASADVFTGSMEGTLFLIESKKIDGYKVWEVAKSITTGAERRSDSNVYKATNTKTTGTVKPTHREGTKFDGDDGVAWEYMHSGYGIVRIDTVSSGTSATATVISRVPSQAVGSGNATTRWAPAAWRSDVGYPALVKIFRERLCFARGQEVWGSVSGDFENFANRDGAETLPDSSFAINIGSSETNAAVWMVASDALLVGTRGAVFGISEVTTAEVFGPGNIRAVEESRFGSRQVLPARVGSSTLFTQRAGRRVRDLRYTFSEEGYSATDMMVLSDHVLSGQVIQMKYALEPHSIVWCICNDGTLRGFTYQLEQDVIGWHPHVIGGTGAAVESIAVIPAPTGSHDQVWMIVRRTIDGVTKRYIEYFDRDWLAEERAIEDAVFMDSASFFDGAIPPGTGTIGGGTTWAEGEVGTCTVTGFAVGTGDVGDHLVLVGSDGAEARVRIDSAANPLIPVVTFVTDIPVSLRNTLTSTISWARNVISGLDYLEGEEVDILAEGAPHPRRTVSGGEITLQYPRKTVTVGTPCPYELITMRIEGGSATGTAQGKTKRVHRVTLRLHESLGGEVGPVGNTEAIEYRTVNDPMDAAPPVFTGDVTVTYPEGFNTDARIRVYNEQPLPMTVCGVFPRLVVEDGA